MKPLMIVLSGALLGLGGCDSNADVQPLDTTSTSTSAETSTGSNACDLEFEAEAALDPDPDGCYDIEDETACVAMTDKCMGLYGASASYSCEDSAWCVTDPNASTYLGCRPTTICKQMSKMVCTTVNNVVSAYWTAGCVPKGFGECQPMFIAADSMQPPATCE